MAEKIPLVFFRTAAGNEPLRDWLRELPQADRLAIGRDLARVQYRWPVGMPLARPLGQGLWEVRTSLAGNRIARGDLLLSRGRVGGALRLHQEKPQNTTDRDESGPSPFQGAVEMSKKKRSRHHGSSIDDFLEEEGVLKEFQAVAIKEVIAWQIEKAMKEKKLSKNKMAALMHTSRAQLDRLLDPAQGNITIETLQRAADALGRSLRIELN